MASLSKKELLKYCFFYKGEAEIPEQLDHTSEGKLWQAEMMVCEHFREGLDSSDIRLSIANMIVAYVSKWDPYYWVETMETYFQKAPDLKQQILSIYA